MKHKLTVIYYTSNREDENFERKIRARLLKTIGDIPLISVSQKPIKFGKNICVGDVGVSNQNAFRQLQIGAMEAKTPFVASAEADCLYPREYFEHIPEKLYMCHRYDNIWTIYKNSKFGFVKKKYSECAQIWGKETLIRHLERRLKGRGVWRSTLEHGVEVPMMFRRKSWIDFHGEIPVINIKTTDGMYKNTGIVDGQEPKNVKRLPFWGTSTSLRKKIFSK